MSKFVPWTDWEAEKAAQESSDILPPLSDNHSLSRAEYAGFLKGVAWAAAQIEKCETITHGLEGGEFSFGDTHEAKLVGVREVNHE